MKKIFVEKRFWYILNTDLKQIPLFFFVDNFQGKISADIFYETFFLNKKQNFYGNFYDGLLGNKTLNYNGKIYDYSFFVDFILQENKKEAAVVFSEKLNKNVVSKLKQIFFEKGFKIYPQNLAYYILNAYLTKENALKSGKFAVINALSETLFISVFDLDSGIKNMKNICLGRLYQPVAYAITKSILEDISKIYRKLSQEEFQQEFDILYHKIKNIEQNILTVEAATLSIGIFDNTQRYLVNVKRDEIYKEADLYSKKTIVAIKEILGKINFSKIICVGLYENDNFAKAWGKLKNKLYFTTLQEVAANLDKKPDIFLFEQKEKLNILTLKDKQVVKLTGFDPRPGKGKSLQIFSYMGDNKFEVMQSTRSLKKGDIAEALQNIWQKDTQLDFKIYRGNKFYGVFRTRNIVAIEVQIT